MRPGFPSRPCFKTKEHSSIGTLLCRTLYCSKVSQYQIQTTVWPSFSGMSDSIEENQTYAKICSSSVLVMHRPDIRQEPEEIERKWEAVVVSGNKKKQSDFLQITRMPVSTKWQIYSKLIIQRLGLEHFSNVEQIHRRRYLQIRRGHMCELNTALEHTEDNVGQRQLVLSPCLSHVLTYFLKPQNTPVTKYST